MGVVGVKKFRFAEKKYIFSIPQTLNFEKEA